MMQSKILSDAINYHKYGLEYALNQVKEDYTCQTCRKKHRTIEDARQCCAKE